ncbi:putative disease resistance protein At4g19050 [Cynara cardunculus var. scolymus]|uniref:putative disease resistance protein At4g19050 n=1 Tax=Cynara cardunculus var. scolymus TaxID=59895 RepID=UPI000D62580D|nr:putative disease resistance protein At4g19050 [Cynara cardunculus var. scolymus]
MERMSSIQQLKKIYEALQHNNKVNLFGSQGVGKTWMAKRVSDHGIRYKLFDCTLWVFICRNYDRKSLSESIARQLCLFPNNEEWEVEDDLKEQRISDEEENLEFLIDEIRKKLKRRKILLILDDIPDDEEESKANEDKFLLEWEEMLFGHADDIKLQTVIISRSSKDIQDLFTVKVEGLPRADSSSLLIEKIDVQLRQSPRIRSLGENFIEKSNHFPGTVSMIAKVLNYFGLNAFGVSMLEKELKEASEEYSVNKLLCRMHDVLPIGVLKDLWWDGHHFFRDSGSVHYNELITYWILEGYLGFNSMTELYEKGHHVLMELMDCGLLKEQESGYVFMDKSLLNVDDLYQCLDQIPYLGLATVFMSDTEGFGTITHNDGMLKTPWTSKTGKNQGRKQLIKEVGQNLSTLLLDGTHFSEKDLMGFLEPEKELQVLALFNPTINSLVQPLAMMDTLRVLVLRGCVFLEDINLPLKALCVLEISGARSFNDMKPEIFDNMPKLQSLNLSELQITSLPNSIYGLAELKWLVIKDCPHLKRVRSLAKLKHLLVLDLSGNVSLDYVDKNFLEFKDLQILNLSNTMVLTTPLLINLKKLTHLLLRDCKNLGRLRSLTSIESLRTLDLSGSTNFEEFHDPSLTNLISLQTMDLSGTTVDRLPINIAYPRYLHLKNCLRLQQLSCINPLVHLEVLDLSGSKNLIAIEDDFFDRMKCLRVLNLSQTNLKILPSLSNLSNLRELLLSRCASLVELPSLESATKLEVLDVSHCGSLEDIANPSFETMISLQKLDLSETKIKYLPALSNPSNLRQLVLKNCTILQNLELNVSLLNLEVLNLACITSLAPNGVEPVKDMINLQFLDLSGTPIGQLPPMSNLKNLAHLSLAGCRRLEAVPNLDHLSNLEVLDLSGSSIKRLPNFSSFKNLRKLLLKDCVMVEDFPDMEINNLLAPGLKLPHEISSLTHLDYLEFPNILSKEMNQDQWNICRLSDDHKPPLFISGTQFLHILKKSPSLQGTFHLCAVPFMAEGETANNNLRRHELVFADVHLRTHAFMENRSLQIRGFNQFPKGIENIIDHINLVFLIDNKFNSSFSALSVSILKDLKDCWIERCDEMVTIFDQNETKDDPVSGIGLQNLGVSNNRRLTRICNGKQSIGWFNNLKTLYLDGCPQLSTVFSSSWLPKNLKVLEIKHCDKIASLSEADSKLELPYLETLHLRELPELKTIGISFPSLQTLKICECPKVKQIENFEFAKDLRTLWISGATSLKSLYSENVNGSCFPLRNIKIIKIRSCEKLQTLFSHSISVDSKLRWLNTLHLEDLPMLKSIGISLPPLQEKRILGCPNLQFDGTIGDQN